MYPRITHIGPLSLPFPIYSFGLMVVIGFAAGVTLAGRLARQRRLPGEAFMDAAVLVLFASVAGARTRFRCSTSGRAGCHSTAAWRAACWREGSPCAGIACRFSPWRTLPLPAWHWDTPSVE